MLVAWSHIPDAAVGIVADRRLIKTLLVLKGEASAHPARTDEETKLYLRGGPDKPEIRRDGVRSDLTRRLACGAHLAGRVRHGCERIPLDNITVTIHANQRGGKQEHCAQN